MLMLNGALQKHGSKLFDHLEYLSNMIINGLFDLKYEKKREWI